MRPEIVARRAREAFIKKINKDKLKYIQKDREKLEKSLELVQSLIDSLSNVDAIVIARVKDDDEHHWTAMGTSNGFWSQNQALAPLVTMMIEHMHRGGTAPTMAVKQIVYNLTDQLVEAKEITSSVARKIKAYACRGMHLIMVKHQFGTLNVSFLSLIVPSSLYSCVHHVQPHAHCVHHLQPQPLHRLLECEHASKHL